MKKISRKIYVGISVIFLIVVIFVLKNVISNSANGLSNFECPEGYISNSSTTRDLDHCQKISADDLFTLDVPLSYFSEDDVEWGDSHETIFGGEMAYQSFPTTTITYKDYSNEIKDLPKKLSWQETAKMINEVGDKSAINAYKDMYDTDTEWSSRFFGDHVAVDHFDIDNDGKAETILYLCGTFGNHCPHEAKIIKNGKEIFSSSNLSAVVETKTHNGFFIDWISEVYLRGGALCCNNGNVRTRFVYKDGKFIPVMEQQIGYIRINEALTP